MISEQEAENLKKQLIEQIKQTFPEDKKQEAIEKLAEMNNTELEEFLIKNKIIKTGGLEKESTQKCIFCSIISGEIPSNKLDENRKAIAILELNPISKGHSIILPKEHIEDSGKIPSQALTLAKKLSKKIKTKLKPKQVTIISSNLFNHEFINIIPVYKDEYIGSPRKEAKPEELLELKKILEAKQKTKTHKPAKKSKIQKTEKETKYWLNPRIP